MGGWKEGGEGNRRFLAPFKPTIHPYFKSARQLEGDTLFQPNDSPSRRLALATLSWRGREAAESRWQEEEMVGGEPRDTGRAGGRGVWQSVEAAGRQRTRTLTRPFSQTADRRQFIAALKTVRMRLCFSSGRAKAADVSAAAKDILVIFLQRVFNQKWMEQKNSRVSTEIKGILALFPPTN